jgi:hypothetical protein
MARQNAIGIYIEEGTNANGRWLQVGDTLQCWHTLTLTFASVAAVAATWTYPKAFASATTPKVYVTLEDNMASAAPSIQMVSAPYAAEASITNTTSPIALTRVFGQTNFVSGNTVKVVVHAVGTP